MDKRMERGLDYAVLLATSRGARMGHLSQNCPKYLSVPNGRHQLDYYSVILEIYSTVRNRFFPGFSISGLWENFLEVCQKILIHNQQ